MIVLKATQDKVLSVLQSVAGIVERRHTLPVLANVGLASAFYSLVARDTFWAQLAGILVVFVWNYAASSRFVWNTP